MYAWPLITPLGAIWIVFVLCVFVGLIAHTRHGMRREMENHRFWVLRTQDQLDRTHMGQPHGRPYDWGKENE